ncbi:MAG: hypothetical protein IPJ19_01485 [Planctomycetes bacterium]|nr:hypothetical protein [Planctomycetota bacterium]
MNGERRLAWVAFGAWLLVCFALQGQFARGGTAMWFPELGLVLLFSLLARMEERDAWIAGVLAALVRSAFSSEPPLVQLSGLLGFALLVMALRSSLEISAPLLRGVVAVLCIFACDLWIFLACCARTYWAHGSLAGFEPPVLPLALIALSSGVLALVAGPLLAQLPGLSPLRSRRW